MVILGLENSLGLVCLFRELLGINQVSRVGKLAQMGNGRDRVIDRQKKSGEPWRTGQRR
jgi:hypothetical protein